MFGHISKQKQRFAGTLFSYLNYFVTTLITFGLVPLLLQHTSESDYSVYKIVLSLSAPLSVMNFGVSSYVQRAISRCNQLQGEENKKRPKILGLSLSVSMILWLIFIGIAFIVYALIPYLFRSTFSESEMALAKTLFLILAGTTSVGVLDNGFVGCINGNERFAFSCGALFVRSLFRIGCLYLVFSFGFGTVGLCFSDLFLAVLLFFSHILYVKAVLKEKFSFNAFDRAEFRIFFRFSIAVFLQTLVNALNNNLDNVILGAFIADKSIIAMYSSALTLVNSYALLTAVVPSVFFPKIIQMVSANVSIEEQEKVVLKIGRIQAFISLGILAGFALFGQNFVSLWIGDKYSDTYCIALFLMAPYCLSSITQFYDAYFDAFLKQTVKAIILFGVAVFNLGVSIGLLYVCSYWGAAIGTFLSVFLGYVVALNIYGEKLSGISALKIYWGSLRLTVPAVILSSIACLPFVLFKPTITMAG